MSDSHGNKDAMLKTVAHESPEWILHLGDFDRDCAVIEWDYPEISLRTVRGNSDRSSAGLDADEFVLAGKRFYMTHGHLFSVKTGKTTIINYAISHGIDILLFGHTHIPFYKEQDNIVIINPGSIGSGDKTYAILEIEDGVVTCEIKNVKLPGNP
jgi:hypothetical protein